MWSKHAAIVVTLAVVTLLAQPTFSAYVIDIQHPLVLRYGFNFTIVDVLALNSTRVALVVSYEDRSAIVVLDLDDPVAGPRIAHTYPVAGRVTATAIDGYPPTRFAVGSDRGEVYLFKIDGGRLYQLLHLIQGADFRVLDIFVARSADRFKVVATVSEGTPTGLCTNCYVYVFDEDRLGSLIISPHTITTATGYHRRVYPQMAIPAKVYTPGGYYYKADVVALFWAPYFDVVIAELNVSHYINATIVEPARRALIEISLRDPATRAVRVYGWNADDSGLASIPIPRGYLANITVVGSTRRFLIRENVNTSAIFRRFRVEATVPERASTDLAEEVYGLPFFAKYHIDFLDLTNAPVSYRALRSLDKEFYPTVARPHLVDYGEGYLIALMNRTYLELYNLDYNFNLQPAAPVALEYLGAAAVSIVDVLTYSKSDVVVGFSDGRVKHYRFNDLKNGYEFAQAIVTLGSLVRIQPFLGYSYFTFSTRGVQVVVLTPYQLPILRVGFQAEFSVEGLVSASSLPRAELVALASHSELHLVVNLAPALTRPTPINLNNYVAPSIEVKVSPPAPQELVNGSRVLLRYSVGGRLREIFKVLTEGSVKFTNTLPGMNYSLQVIPSRDYISNYSTIVRVPRCGDRCYNVTISVKLQYREFVLKLIVRDEFRGSLLGRLRVSIDGVTYSYRAPEGLSVKLLYGYHNITIESLDRFYLDSTTRVKVEADSELEVVLKRARYNLTIRFFDEVSRRLADPRLVVSINGTLYAPTPDSAVTAIVPAGVVSVEATPMKDIEAMYRKLSTTLLVNKSTITELFISRKTYDLSIVALDELTRREARIRAVVHVNGTEVLEDYLPSRVSLPYGNYVIEIRPVGEYSGIYSTSAIELTLDSNKNVSIPMYRNIYSLNLNLRDRYSGKPIVPLKIIVNGTLYTTTTAHRLSVPLRAGSYTIRVEPVEEHLGSYIPFNATLNLVAETELTVNPVRRNYTLTLRIVDVSARGYLEGKFRVSLNATISVVVDWYTASRGFSMLVPYGRYVLSIVPVDEAEKLYVEPQPVIIEVYSNSSYIARASRKLYTLVITVISDLEERLSNAGIQILDPGIGLELASLLTNEAGEARIIIPAGTILIRVAKGGFSELTDAMYLSKETVVTFKLNPTIVTLVGRFTHVIALVVVAIAVVIIVLKLRAKLAERLAAAEEIF
ncbi:MAG: hypothetical protein RMH84_01610 [Sulfolobales archaeon]|nr:hypothetical protein [Sulfolobales archaeon]MDW8010280.1 hypothetical protein [Sulfolobales archaeon]